MTMQYSLWQRFLFTYVIFIACLSTFLLQRSWIADSVFRYYHKYSIIFGYVGTYGAMVNNLCDDYYSYVDEIPFCYCNFFLFFIYRTPILSTNEIALLHPHSRMNAFATSLVWICIDSLLLTFIRTPSLSLVKISPPPCHLFPFIWRKFYSSTKKRWTNRM